MFWNKHRAETEEMKIQPTCTAKKISKPSIFDCVGKYEDDYNDLGDELEIEDDQSDIEEEPLDLLDGELEDEVLKNANGELEDEELESTNSELEN